MKPTRKTAEHRHWMVDQLLKVADRLGIANAEDLPLREFLRHSEDASRRDIDAVGKWNDLKEMAQSRLSGINGPVGQVELPFDPAVPEGYYVKEVKTQVDSEGRIEKQWLRTPLSQAPGELVPQLPGGHRIAGVSTFVSGDGRTIAQWVKTKEETESREETIARIMANLPDTVPVRESNIPKPDAISDSQLLAVYPMGDPHIGMLSWAPETGTDFDLAKAQNIMKSAMRELVIRGPRTKTALIVNLGDFFHSDNEENRTARAGHALDVDGRWPKVLQVGVEIMVHMIDLALMHHEQVHVINEIGNHDDHSAIFLSVALNAYYRNEPRVQIDLSPSRFHWFKFGKNLIGVTHGHNQKHSDLGSIMATERAEDWGNSLHRFWYCGHIHHSVKQELRGCVVETFRTLAPADAWAATKGYRSGRDMNRITLHEEYGEIGREVVNAAFLHAKYMK